MLGDLGFELSKWDELAKSIFPIRVLEMGNRRRAPRIVDVIGLSISLIGPIIEACFSGRSTAAECDRRVYGRLYHMTTVHCTVTFSNTRTSSRVGWRIFVAGIGSNRRIEA
jgi:hypothetical protein